MWLIHLSDLHLPGFHFGPDAQARMTDNLTNLTRTRNSQTLLISVHLTSKRGQIKRYQQNYHVQSGKPRKTSCVLFLNVFKPPSFETSQESQFLQPGSTLNNFRLVFFPRHGWNKLKHLRQDLSKTSVVSLVGRKGLDPNDEAKLWLKKGEEIAWLVACHTQDQVAKHIISYHNSMFEISWTCTL